MKDKICNIEYFIFDAKLKEIAQKEDVKALTIYKKDHPGCEDVIEQAVLLFQNLKIDQAVVSQEQIDEDYKKLLEKVTQQKKIRYPIWWSVAGVAACVSLVVLLTTLFKAPEVSDLAFVDNTKMLSMLDSLNKNTDDIQLIAGATKVKLSDNDKIEQTEDGNVIVGEEEKMKSSDIKTEFVQLVVPNGKRTSIRFNDGTVAWVNAGTKLIYPKTFAADKREIFVDGEVYLEVNKSEEKPFYVHTKAFDVSVLGTKFNVSAYSEDVENSVVLVNGSVAVKIEDNNQVLKPEQGIFTTNGTVKVKYVDTYSYTCWKDGIMKVSGETLGSMFMRLSRHYNIQIQCDDLYITRERYRGKLNLHDSLEEVLYNLSLSTPFLFKRENDNTIVIYTPN